MIKFDNVSLTYQKLSKPTLENINIQINKGEKVLVIGPSGSGKTTFSRMINGIIPNQYKSNIEGAYSIIDIDVKSASIFDFSKKVGTILQDQDAQFIGLSVGEDVAFYDENNKVDVKTMHEKVIDVLTKLNCLNLINMSPHQLSGGQKQRVSIAGILSNDVDILLFDEPLASLDPKSSSDVMGIIDQLNKSGKTIIVIEHRIEDVIEFNFDRVILINDKSIVYNGSVNELLKGDLLLKNKMRKPLYLELFDYLNIDYSNEKSLWDVNSISKSYFDKINLEANTINVKEFNDVVLSVKNVSYAYNDKKVLHEVSFDIKSNSITALLGNNGAGKTTITKIISGIVRDYVGNIFIDNKCIDTLNIYERGNLIGYVMQNPNHMITKNTVYDEVKSYNYNANDELIDRILETCSLLEYKKWPISMLSYGQKRRVTIASVLMKNPRVILLDEPTAGQDYETFNLFMKTIKNIAKNNVAIILITHNMQLAIEFCDHALILNNGNILLDDVVENVFANGNVLETASLKLPSIANMALHLGIDVNKTVQLFGRLNNE